MVDWKAMTPREVFEAKRTAPKLVAGPWVAFEDGSGSHREDESGKSVALEWTSEGETVVRLIEPKFLRVSSRADADTALTGAGYIVVDPTPFETKSAPQ
jgi:hypothetical protein